MIELVFLAVIIELAQQRRGRAMTSVGVGKLLKENEHDRSSPSFSVRLCGNYTQFDDGCVSMPTLRLSSRVS